MRRAAALVLSAFLLSALLPFQFLRPVPRVAATAILPAQERVGGEVPSFPWPRGVAAAVAVAGAGTIAVHWDSTPRPIASVAKVMTALVVVDDHPLPDLDGGPSIAITAADEQRYVADQAAGQSVVKVVQGESLSEFQLLQGLLIASGNNFATILARWDAGEVDAFVTKMNGWAAALGMRRSHFADPSGFSEQTVGTAEDLLLAAAAVINIPVLARIVAQAQADLPVAGTIYNVNYALGGDGIIGIKTGSAPRAGACFLFAALRREPGPTVTILGAILGEPTLDDAFEASRNLIAAVASGLRVVRAVTANQPVGAYRGPWGSRAKLVAEHDLDMVAWPGQLLNRRIVSPAVLPPLRTGSAAGHVEVWVGNGPPARVPLSTTEPLLPPGDFWRWTRPLTDSP